MGAAGPLFGIIFYLLVIIAAISSAISLMEVIGTFFLDRAAAKGKQGDRTKVTIWVSVAIMVEALIVAIDGLGSNGIWVPGQAAFGIDTWNDCWLDFMDCWSEGIAMPLGAMLMGLMVGWELKPKFILDEVHSGESSGFFDKFYSFCVKVVVPVVMAFVLAGQVQGFFTKADPNLIYAIAGVLLVVFFVVAFVGNKKTESSQQ